MKLMISHVVVPPAENFRHTRLLQSGYVLIRYNAPTDDQDIMDSFLPQQVHDPGEEIVVGAGKDAHRDQG